MFNPDWKNVRDSLMERVDDFAKANPQAVAGYARLEEGAGKGKALSALCRALGFTAEEAVAFGDGSNDSEMLRTAGLGVAMGNAMDSVKAVADEITASNDDCGVARTIRRLLAEG